MNQLTSTLLLISLAGAQALAESHSAQNRHFPRGTNAEITHKCQGVERTAQRGWLLYDSNPEPWWFFPLVLSEVHVIGAMSAGQQFTILQTGRQKHLEKALRLAGGARARQQRRRRKVFGRLDNDAPRQRQHVGDGAVSRHRGEPR